MMMNDDAPEEVPSVYRLGGTLPAELSPAIKNVSTATTTTSNTARRKKGNKKPKIQVVLPGGSIMEWSPQRPGEQPEAAEENEQESDDDEDDDLSALRKTRSVAASTAWNLDAVVREHEEQQRRLPPKSPAVLREERRAAWMLTNKHRRVRFEGSPFDLDDNDDDDDDDEDDDYGLRNGPELVDDEDDMMMGPPSGSSRARRRFHGGMLQRERQLAHQQALARGHHPRHLEPHHPSVTLASRTTWQMSHNRRLEPRVLSSSTTGYHHHHPHHHLHGHHHHGHHHHHGSASTTASSVSKACGVISSDDLPMWYHGDREAIRHSVPCGADEASAYYVEHHQLHHHRHVQTAAANAAAAAASGDGTKAASTTTASAVAQASAAASAAAVAAAAAAAAAGSKCWSETGPVRYSLDDYEGPLQAHVVEVLRGIIEAAGDVQNCKFSSAPGVNGVRLLKLDRALRGRMLAAKRPIYDVVRQFRSKLAKLRAFGELTLRFVRSMQQAMRTNKRIRFEMAVLALDAATKWLDGTALVPSEAQYRRQGGGLVHFTSPIAADAAAVAAALRGPPSARNAHLRAAALAAQNSSVIPVAAGGGAWCEAALDASISLWLAAVPMLARDELESYAPEALEEIARVVAASGGMQQQKQGLGGLAQKLPCILRITVLGACSSLKQTCQLRLVSKAFRALIEPLRLNWVRLVGQSRHHLALSSMRRILRLDHSSFLTDAARDAATDAARDAARDARAERLL